MFHKYGGANVAVKNYKSQFSMFFLTKATVKLANWNMGNAQGVGIISCHFPKCSIIYPVVSVYYFPGLTSNTILAGALKCYACFQKLKYEPLEHFYFVDPQGSSCRSSYFCADSCNGVETHTRLNEMRAQERKVEYKK